MLALIHFKDHHRHDFHPSACIGLITVTLLLVHHYYCTEEVGHVIELLSNAHSNSTECRVVWLYETVKMLSLSAATLLWDLE